MLSFRPKLFDTLPGYNRSQALQDISAGITVGVLALPLAIAFAIASGASPTAGIWTAIVAGFLTSALGGSRVQIGGPTGAFIPIVYGIVAAHGMGNLMIATMIAGLILLTMGATRIGGLIRYIPLTVVIGFTNGIAVVIFMSQIKDFLGLDVTQVPADFFPRVKTLWAHLNEADYPTLAFSTLSLAFLIAWNKAVTARWPGLRHVPGPLALLVVGTTIQALGHFPVETIGSRFGGIPQEIPPIGLPSLSLETLRSLISPAVTIALLGAIESLLSARVADNQIQDRHDPNQELMAQGLANLAAPLFGGFAATGAIARTTTNIRSGGRTPVAGMVHALTLLAVVLIAAPLAQHVPLPLLSAILMVVAWNMGEWHAFAELRRYSLNYRIILISTFLVTVIFDLTLAVELGMVLASLFFITRMSDLTQVERVPLEAFFGEHALVDEAGHPRIVAYRMFGSLFFGAIGKLEALLEVNQDYPRVLILDLDKVVNIDTTGLDILQGVHRNLGLTGGTLVLCGLNPQPLSLIRRSGFAAALGDENLVYDLTEAMVRARELNALPPTPVLPA